MQDTKGTIDGRPMQTSFNKILSNMTEVQVQADARRLRFSMSEDDLLIFSHNNALVLIHCSVVVLLLVCQVQALHEPLDLLLLARHLYPPCLLKFLSQIVDLLFLLLHLLLL